MKCLLLLLLALAPLRARAFPWPFHRAARRCMACDATHPPSIDYAAIEREADAQQRLWEAGVRDMVARCEAQGYRGSQRLIYHTTWPDKHGKPVDRVDSSQCFPCSIYRDHQ